MKKEVRVNVKYDVDLRLTDLTEDVYRRIMDFIEREIPDEVMCGGDGPEDHGEERENVCLAVEDVPLEADAGEGDGYADLFRKMKQYSPIGAVEEIFVAAHEHPEKYTREWRLSSEFRTMYGELLSDYTRLNVGAVLGECAKYLPDCEKKYGYNDSTHAYENRYLVPIPVKEEKAPDADGTEEEVCVRKADYDRGQILRLARQEAGLSVADLASLIGYGTGIVSNWETGVYGISPDAEDALKTLFGKDLFNGKEDTAN